MVATHSLVISPELPRLVAGNDEFKGAWRAFGTFALERLQALRRVATIESIGSSTRMEGSKLNDQQVAELLGRLSAQSFATRDEQEVAGDAAVMELVFSSWEHIAVTENHIGQLHRDLLQFTEKDAWHRGRYKTVPNNASAFDEAGREIDVVFVTATPLDTPGRMTELIDWTRKARAEDVLHPLVIVAIFIVVFLEIRPFQDGNGRLSRVLATLLLLLQAGYAYVPFSSLESVIEQNKQGYDLALRQTQGTIRGHAPNWQPWLTFFLQALTSQVRRLQTKVEHEKIVLASLPDLSLSILELTRSRGRITVAEPTGD